MYVGFVSLHIHCTDRNFGLVVTGGWTGLEEEHNFTLKAVRQKNENPGLFPTSYPATFWSVLNFYYTAC